MEFGEKMRQLLDKKGLTQKEFAQAINMNYAHTNKFFTGRKPNMEFITKITDWDPSIDLNWLLLSQADYKLIDRAAEPTVPYNKMTALKYISSIEEELTKFKEFLTQK